MGLSSVGVDRGDVKVVFQDKYDDLCRVLIGFIAGGFSIAATNGGIGLYPIAVAGALALFDIPSDPATAFGWIMWTAQTAMIIIFGGLAFLFLPIYNKHK